MVNARASALGVLPGVSAQEAAQVAAGEFPDALFLPILPKRGPGADPVGRTAALLSSVSSDFSTSVVPSGWQISRTPGVDMQRAKNFLRQDQDAMEEHAQDFAGLFTCSVVGPISWCASVEAASGEKLIRDRGAVSEVAHVLTEGLRGHVASIARIFPRAELAVVLEEPHAPAACSGAIPTASGLNTYVNVDRARILGSWEPLIAMAGACGASFGVSLVDSDELFTQSLMVAGAKTFFPAASSRFLGEQLEAHNAIYWQVKPGWSPRKNARDIAQRITSLGFELSATTGSLVVVPTPASVSDSWVVARPAITAVREVVDLLNDEDRLLGE
ncbi:MAG: hypothetical protein OR995_03375 [Candidatus Nanopelagicales bacterium]|nr:hypothetical protein [Candidatus Nanopelagicales bacterium]